jgi:hypothetical protein
MGGLGIVDIKLFGMALRLRWLWLQRIDPSCLWSLLPIHEDNVAKAFFCSSTIVVLGNGNKINFWQDPWLDCCSISKLVPDLAQVVSRRRCKTHSVVKALVNGVWIKGVTGPRATPVMMQFMLVFWRLQNVVLNPEAEDKLIWHWDSSGAYNAASTYTTLFLEQTSILGAKEVCKTKAPNKYRFFAWLALLGRNWTLEHLLHHGLRDEVTCALCAQEPETIDHLMTQCVFSWEVWLKVLRWCGWQNFTLASHIQMVDWWLAVRK